MILYRRDMLPCAQSKAAIFTCQLHGTENFIPVCFLRSRPAESPNRKGEDGTVHASDYSFSCAPAQSIEEVEMSLVASTIRSGFHSRSVFTISSTIWPCLTTVSYDHPGQCGVSIIGAVPCDPT